MTNIYNKFLPIIVLFLLFCFQVAGQRATRQSAQDAFDKGDYKRAYNDFTELLEVYTRDPVYKYYASVSLIKLEQDAEQAETLIKEAIEYNTSARSIPSDATFYLARALQMTGNFTEAISVYQRFADQAGRRTARDFRVQDYINQCSKGEGAIAKTQPEKQIAIEREITNSADIPLFTTPEIVAEQKTIPADEPLSESFSDVLDKALSSQFLADSLQRVNEMFATTNVLMNPQTEEINTQTDNEIIPVPVETQAVYYYFEVLNKPLSATIQIDPEMPEGLNYRIQIAVFRNPVTHESFKGITPVYGITNANNPELKTYYAGMFRRIADARTALTEVKNKGFNDSFIVNFLGDRVVSADRAAVLEQEWGTKSFERIIEKEDIQYEVIAVNPVPTDVDKPTQVADDELLPTLVFRVEVMRVTRAITPAALETLQTLAGNRGLDVITTDDKKIAYIIGNFITYTSAAEYADLLVRNGYRDTKVVAWLGNREIPLETARQLFESLE